MSLAARPKGADAVHVPFFTHLNAQQVLGCALHVAAWEQGKEGGVACFTEVPAHHAKAATHALTWARLTAARSGRVVASCPISERTSGCASRIAFLRCRCHSEGVCAWAVAGGLLFALVATGLPIAMDGGASERRASITEGGTLPCRELSTATLMRAPRRPGSRRFFA